MNDHISGTIISEMAGKAENASHQVHMNEDDAFFRISEYTAAKEQMLTAHPLLAAVSSTENHQGQWQDRTLSSLFDKVSHETKTSLNWIIGFAQYLKSKSSSIESHAQYFDIIINSGNRLLKVNNNLLYFYRLESGCVKTKREECSLNEELKKMSSDFNSHPTPPGRNEVAFEQSFALPDGEDHLFIDWFHLREVLMRLLDNAFKYTSKGKVKLSYRLKNSHKLMFFVRDTGEGIPDDGKKRIFDASTQLQEQAFGDTQGIGLGLNIAKKLVHLMGGELDFYSKAGRGSCFYFSLPCKFSRSGKYIRKEPKRENQLSPA